MPTYEYICEKCEHRFETVQSINDQSLTTCPKDQCGLKRWGKGKVKRSNSGGAGLNFKGSGFYITDYRSEGYKAAAKKDSAAASESKPVTAKTETKSSPPASGSTPAK